MWVLQYYFELIGDHIAKTNSVYAALLESNPPIAARAFSLIWTLCQHVDFISIYIIRQERD